MVAVAAFLVSACTPGTQGPPFPGTTQRVSLATASTQIEGDSLGGALSDDGQWVAFTTLEDLDPGDTNGLTDVYVRSPEDFTTRLMTPSVFGPTNGASADVRISGNGKNVTYTTTASSMSFSDGNGVEDVYFTNVLAGVPFPVSVVDGLFPTFGNARSYGAVPNLDGNVIAFTTDAGNLAPGDANGHSDAVVKDLATGAISLVSVSSTGVQGNLPSFVADISGDGRYVVFTSLANNLVPGDTNGVRDLFIRDRLAGTTNRVNLSSTGAQDTTSSGPFLSGAKVSDDGRYVSFHSSAALVPGDTNGLHDVYRRDMVAGTTARASVPAGGGEYDQVAYGADMSNDGRYVLFLLRQAGFADGGLGIVADMAANTVTTVTLRSGTDVVSPTTVADPPDIPMPLVLYRFAGYSPELARPVTAGSPCGARRRGRRVTPTADWTSTDVGGGPDRIRRAR